MKRTNPAARRDTEYIAPFKPYPWAIPAWRDTSPIIVCEGGAGGGKSIFAANKCHAFALKYPDAVVAILRKERAVHINSTIPLFQRWAVGDDPRVTPVLSKSRYEYDNGSTVLLLGMADGDQRERVRSMSFDMAWMEEATQFEEADHNEVLGRMRGTAGTFRQIIATTNPDGPTHWIKRRLIDGIEAHVYLSSAKDNPNLPASYHDSLAQMTGIQRQRLLEGKWVQAEGVIYDNWALENIAPDADYHPDYGAIYWGMDDGYVYGGGPGTASYHPRVVIMAQITPVGGLNVFAEYYRTLELAETTITNVRAMGYPDPDIVYVDSSAAELRGRLSGVGLMNVGATHVVSEGIKTLRRMICDGNGQRLFRVHPRCANLIRELQTYRYSDSTAGVNAGEPKPDKVEDHGPDSARYLAYSLRHLGA
jgi:phage terminase large subunit